MYICQPVESHWLIKRLKDRVVAVGCLQVDLEKEIAIEAHRVVVFVGQLRVGGWAGGRVGVRVIQTRDEQSCFH